MIRWIEIAERRRRLSVVTVLLGYSGFQQHYEERIQRATRTAEELRATRPDLAVLAEHVASDSDPPSDWTVIYLTAQLFVMESGALAAFLGRGLSGWRPRSMRRHSLVCGLGRRAAPGRLAAV